MHAGKAGLWTKAASVTYFDDFSVAAMSEAGGAKP